MNNNIFRQKNIEKINSPESLNDYVKVTNPSVWIILLGVIILIAGALVFGTIGKIDTNINTVTNVSDGTAITYIDENNIDKINSSMKVKIDGEEYNIINIESKPIKASEVDEYVLHKGNIEISQWLYPITVNATLKDGVYSSVITIEQTSPISYIFN